LIYHDVTLSLEELYERCLNTPLPIDGGNLMVPHVLVIDSGYRTDEVYEFAKIDSRIVPIKGANQQLRTPIQLSKAGKDFGVSMRYIDTGYYKDRLSTLRADPERWLVHRDITEEYCQHLASEHKIHVRKGLVMEEQWKPVTDGAANHYLDCEVYNVVGAQVGGVDLIPTAETLLEIRTAEAQQQADRERQATHQRNRYLGNTSGWLGR
jgi:hypothetical protein